jgi:hypothetical protein
MAPTRRLSATTDAVSTMLGYVPGGSRTHDFNQTHAAGSIDQRDKPVRGRGQQAKAGAHLLKGHLFRMYAEIDLSIYFRSVTPEYYRSIWRN